MPRAMGRRKNNPEPHIVQGYSFARFLVQLFPWGKKHIVEEECRIFLYC